MPAHRGYAVAEMLCSAVAQIVAVDAGNDDVTKLERRNGAGEIDRFRGVRRKRSAVSDIAERAAPRAQVPEDHESRGALAETFSDVGAGSFLTDGVQRMAAQDFLDFPETLAGAPPDPYTVGLAQTLRRHDPDRIARGLFSAS